MNYDISKLPLDLILNILSIIILFVILRLLLYKPAKKILDERKERIRKEKEDADAALKDAGDLKAKYEEKLTDAKRAASAEADRIIADAEKRAEAIVSEAESRASTVLSLAESKINAERLAAKKSMERDTVALAVNIAEKILERRINDSDTINMACRLFESADMADIKNSNTKTELNGLTDTK